MSDNSKTLRVCLAMGGGVSLGAFSGAALTEALKLLVLHGQNKKGQKYEKIILDGLSGASAGSITLAILVRCLLDIEKFREMKEVQEYFGASELDVLDEKIRINISNYYTGQIDKDTLKTLMVLEVAQAVQYIIWVKALDIKNMLDEKKKFNAKDPFGLMSKNFLFNLVRTYLIDTVGSIDSDKKVLIGDRILMAFSMANLSPIAYGDKDISIEEYKSMKLIESLHFATSIDNHNELRVFDFVLGDLNHEDFDDKYFTIAEDQRTFPKNYIGIHKLLNQQETWSHIAASAMASGAFPFAFEPIILKRYRTEYSSSEWPDKKLDELNFAYVDGGAFNNEPIKEAFKIGHFQDFRSYMNNSMDDRLILFVDPSVPAGNQVQQLGSLDPLRDLDEKYKNRSKQESDKLTSSAFDLLGMVVSQSKINEEAKVTAFYKSALLKQSITKFLTNASEYDFELLKDSRLIDSFKSMVTSSLKNRQISIGTRKVGELLFKTYTGLCNSKEDRCLTSEAFEKLIDLLMKKDESTEQIQKFLEANDCDETHQNIVAQTILVSITEFALNQTGKSEFAERAGIFPINQKREVEDLPGSEMAAFAGFVNINAREACFLKGRIDALRCLSSTDFREFHYKHAREKDIENIQPYLHDPKDVMIKDLEKKFEDHKKRFDSEITGNVRNDLRDLIVKRIKPIFNEKYGVWNRIKVFWGAAVGMFNPQFVLKKVITKEFLTNFVAMEKTTPIKIRLLDKLATDRITVFFMDGEQKEMKASTIDGARYYKLYWGRYQSEEGENESPAERSKKSLYANSRIRRYGSNNKIDKIKILGKTLPSTDLTDYLFKKRNIIYNGINPFIDIGISDDGKFITSLDHMKTPFDIASQIYDHRVEE